MSKKAYNKALLRKIYSLALPNFRRARRYAKNTSHMIRIYQHGDHIEIASIFSRSIHEIAIESYNLDQCLAWSDVTPNPEHWKKRCELKRPFVSFSDFIITGFLELDSDGHIDCAYTNPDFQRRGIMTSLVKHAITTAFSMNSPSVYAEASLCIRPLFEKLGFDQVFKNTVHCSGLIEMDTLIKDNIVNYWSPYESKTSIQELPKRV